MSPPPIAPFPSTELRRRLVPEEWEACLDAWIALAQLHLRLANTEFIKTTVEDGPLVYFLISYFREVSGAPHNDPQLQGSKALSLRKQSFLLVHRVFSGDPIPPSLLSWSFLADICQAFPRSGSLRDLLQSLWKRKGDAITSSTQKLKSSLIKTLDSSNSDTAQDDLGHLCHLLYVSTDAGAFFITGSDFLDSLCSAYVKASKSIQSKLVTITYLGLMSLLNSPKPNYSLLSDHLYSLKTNAEQEQKSSPGKTVLLAALVTNTPILNKIRNSITSQEGARARNIAASLSTFRQAGLVRPKKLIRRKMDKGKGRANDDEYDHGASKGVHIHRMSLVSQVQDLFPSLGSAFVVKLLDEYGDDAEQVTAHLLEDSLPAYLKDADRSEQIGTHTVENATHLSPRSTPPPHRRNIFDNDELDQLTVSASRLHIGRRNENLTADAVLSDRSAAPNKAAILSALAAFDSDDDERDDTYDAEDVGGTVDAAIPGMDADADLRDRNEEALFKAYTASPEAFGRDAATRRGKPRAALKGETGMTDETIEGWAIMIGRDPRRLRRLEAKFSTFAGQQRELAPTAYRASPADSGAEGDNSGADTGGDGRGGRGGGGYRGRGRGRGRGGHGGGDVAGASDDKGTQVSRQRKEAQKASRANHNRRDQRARKMARGGFPG
ncbi:hypothetical protein K432DRAFT_288989 [Lepidopterella palustris CBS 459.81]|uniref:CUE domain-containing protein n=1 Tax=Lepidopterella palustris CBS 459.81 TaxID=1314670 RepID=A0A8E2EI44_9PEZI|nr:hypothetical protein K432DRAFT_288989 [Lepidopterella palustris CBS 459.81]